jgi:lipoprotein-releasing system permease protein
MMELFVALRYLRGKRKITFTSAGGVFLGTFALVVALAVANGFEKEVRDRIVGTLAHAKLMQYHGRTIVPYDSLIQVLQKHPHVVAAAPYIEGKGVIEHDDVQEGVIILGVDPPREAKVTDLANKFVAGHFRLDTATSARGRVYPGIVIGLGLADKMGVQPGNEVVLMSLATVDGAIDPTPRYERYTVTGIFETGFYEYDVNLVYISIASAQALLGKKGVDGIQFRTTDLFGAGRISREVQKWLGGYPYWATDWRSQNRSLFEWMELEKFIIFIVISLIMVVAGFNIVSSLIMMILEKRREIGVLMGLGAKTGAIMRIFMYSGIAIGFLGSTLGAITSVALCYAQWRWHLIPLPGDIYFIASLPVLVRPLDVVTVYLSANVICWLATLYPAWKASRILPADSIRFE